MSVARRLQDIEPFLAVEVAERAQELERQGVDIVHLGYGEPDFAPPAVVQQALGRAIEQGQMRYTHSLGILALREAIADHYRSTYGVKVSPEQILVTPGTSPAMLLLFGALLDPGDEVVLSDPYFSADSLGFAYEILQQSHVAVTPGVAFGRNAEGYLRFSYSASSERIREGLRRLGAFLGRRR
jgi:aspartate/methionine/tyrosine aminotransferase